MLKEYKQLKISQYGGLYEIVVSENHILRQIKKHIDFSFANKMLEESYSKYYGRPAKEPEMMFKLMFLKALYNLSDERLIEECKCNMAYKYFLDLTPEEEVVSSSLLTVFRKTRINRENLLEEMLLEVVNQASAKGLIKSKAIIIDATHTQMKASDKSPKDNLRNISKELRKEIYRNNFELSKEFPIKPNDKSRLEEEISYVKELIKVIEKDEKSCKNHAIQKHIKNLSQYISNENIGSTVSITDQDARVGYKSDKDVFVGYKTHIAMTEEYLITALEVTSGEKSDGKYLKKLVKATKSTGVNVTEVIADRAYSSRDNLEFLNDENMLAITRLNPVISNGNRKDNGFEYIKDADMVMCPAGRLSYRKNYEDRTYMHKNTRGRKNNRLRFYFDIKKCRQCHLKEGCIKENAKTKSYTVTLLSATHQQQKNFEATDYFKQRSRKRYKIEAKNAELKTAHGLNKSRYMGLFGMKIQSYFTAFVANAKRITKLCELV